MKPYARCPACQLDYTVNHDDRLRSHACPGSGTLIPRADQQEKRIAGPPRRSYYKPRERQYRAPDDITALLEANQQRTLTAARRDTELAGKLLASGWLDERAATIATTRVQHPGWTWRQIGDHLGISKDTAVAVFRRRCQEAGLRP